MTEEQKKKKIKLLLMSKK